MTLTGTTATGGAEADDRMDVAQSSSSSEAETSEEETSEEETVDEDTFSSGAGD